MKQTIDSSDLSESKGSADTQKSLVSVVVPVFNTKKDYLEECFNSIAHQTHKEMEVIIVNDGSDEATARFCERYGEGLSGWRVIHQKNGGASDARNTGLNAATGNYIQFIDADDIIDAQMIEKLVSKANNDDADVVICRYDTFEKDVTDVIDREVAYYPSSNNVTDFANKIFSISSPSIFKMMFKKRLLTDNGLLFDTELIRGEDLLFGRQALAVANRVSVVPEYLYHYRVGVSSSTIAQTNTKNMTTVLALKKLKNFLVEKKLYKRYRAGYQRMLADGTLFFDYLEDNNLFIKEYDNLRKFILDIFGDNKDNINKLLRKYEAVDDMSILIDSPKPIDFFVNKSIINSKRLSDLKKSYQSLELENAELQKELEACKAELNELYKIKPSARRLAGNIKRRMTKG